MASEIEEIVAESIEEIALDDVIEKENEDGKRPRRRRWELWVALSSSLLAVLSAVAALLATFASDEATIALSNETDYAAYVEGSMAGHSVLQAKVGILEALGHPVATAEVEELARLKREGEEFRARIDEFDAEGRRAFAIHDRLAMAVTLFQVTMLLGGLAVMVGRPAIWRFGLLFSLVGLGFLASGLAGYLG